MTSEYTPKFVVLAILDGWGIASEGPSNAIKQANTVNFNKYWASCPKTQLEAAGEAVGLPRGEDGNTETGHLNIGAGRIVYQDLERINMAIADGSFFHNEVLINAIEHSKKYNSNLNLIGLIGAGGVHSNIEHLFALIHLANKNNFKNVNLHLFTDGRDSPQTAAKTYIARIKEVIEKEETGKICSIMGRYWAMDRDQRWERTEKAYIALTKGVGNLVKSPEEAIDKSYSQGQTDEFIEPSIICDNKNNPLGLIKNNDSIIFFNFRIDRPRQLTKAFVLDDFSRANITFDYDPYSSKYLKSSDSKAKIKNKEPFKRGSYLKNLYFVSMTEYGKPITQAGAIPAFPPEVVQNSLSEIISNNGFRQLKITESEKERFVTFYFNGLREKPFSLEDRIIIPSPKVPTYDQKPEMSSKEITEELLKNLASSQYNFVLVNYPNADIVGHTGNIGATVKAVEAVDECLGKLANFVLAYQGILLITADHGNAEEMINMQSGQIDTEHSVNKVPFIAVSSRLLSKPQTLRTGILADIATTVLSIMNINIPSSMTGKNLLGEIMNTF